jgi:hypothetical protein
MNRPVKKQNAQNAHFVDSVCSTSKLVYKMSVEKRLKMSNTNTKLTQDAYNKLVTQLGETQALEVARTLGGVKGKKVKGGKGGGLLSFLEGKTTRTEKEQNVLELFNRLYDTVEAINTDKDVTDAFYTLYPDYIEGFYLDLNWKDKSKI